MADQDETAQEATMKTTIYGVELTSPPRYTEGHPLTAIEARELNKLIMENVANNFRATVKEVKTKLEERGKLDAEGATVGSVLTPKQTEALQAKFLEKANEYKFGVSRRVGASKVDPVEKEARKIAIDQVKAAYKDAGHGIKENLATIKEQAAAHFDSNQDYFMAEAAANIKAREEAAKRALAFKVPV